MSSYIAIQDTPKVRKWSRKRRGQGANVHAESKPSTSHNCSAAVDLLRFFSLARFLDIDTFTDEERIHERETHWQLLGVGACFEVRKALHPSSRSEFAVKTAANEVAGDGKLRAEHMKSLTTELRVMGHPQLRSHRNVIDLLGIIWDSDHNRDPPVVPFLAVEFSRIGTMNSLVNQKTLSFSIKMRLCRDVAAGINALHASNIIHADIKLQNVLIFKDPNSELVAKISDFSSALLSFDEGIRTVNIAKSRPWNAPETDCAMTILAKDIRKIDIFSYGMLFWRTILNGWLDVLSTEEMVCNEVEGMKDRGTLVKDAVMSLRGVKNMDPAQTRNAVSVLESTLQLNPDKRIGRLDYITNLLATPDHAHKTDYNDSRNQLAIGQELENRKIFDIEQHLAQIKHLDETIRRYLFQGFLELASSNMHMAELEAAEAAFQICVCYCLGFGVAADDGEARNWLVKSAWKGLVKARGLVKRLFDACEAEVPPNTPTREWLMEATLGGCPIAAAELEITDGSEHHILLRQRICKSDIDLLKCHYPLDEGIFRGLAPRLEELSANNPDLRINDAGDTFLHFVAVHGGVKLAEDSWRMGVWKNIDEVNNEQESALLLACRAGNEGMIEYLTQNGANVQRASKKGVTPLHWAVTMKRGFSISRIARILVEAGADTEAETNCVIKQSLHSHHINDLPQGTPLAWAISISHVAAVKVLLELDAFATRSHLLAAAFIHDFKTIEILLQEQHLLDEEYCPSDLKNFDESNKSILAYAISGENRFSSLIRHGSQYRSTVRSTLELLLQKGADPECVDITYSGSGDTALMHAVRNSPVEILEMLLNSCPEQLNTHCGDISPIKWTIENENEEKFSFLMDHKAAIEGICDESNGSTLLHHCAYSMNHGAFFAAAIIDRGADIYARSATSYTPVREAVCNGNIDLAKFLICKGGSLSDIDSNGCTTLGSTLTTCSAASLAGVEFLLETSSPNYLVHPERGLGALHFGVCLADKLHDSSIHRQIYDLLLARFKSNLDDVDISGWSPLHLAAAFADPYALRMLLKAGANFSIRDGHGYTPLDIARMTTGLEPSAFWVFGCKLERIEFIQQRITRSRRDTSPSASALTEFGDAMESEWGLENFSEKRSTVIEFLAEWIEKAGEH